MYELTVERQFAAAHHLEGYAGPCARLHGHNYRVRVTFRTAQLDERGFAADFTVLKRACDQVLEPLDHRYLNDLSDFAGDSPTAERLACYLFQRVRETAADLPVQVAAVTVCESDNACVTYREG